MNNNIEEKLWEYIDGNCTADEQKAISSLIASDETYRLKYQELVNFNNQLSAMELDEPPMAFTYNVIEAIRTEQAQQPLKAAVNKRIIRGIGLFFVITIAALLVFVLANINWSSIGASSVDVNVKLPKIINYLTRPVIQGFLFFDLILGLFLFDHYLRKKNIVKEL
jgi:anti-sigma factor RsiW